MERQILPKMGAFVVFTVDPIASLDPECLEDPEAVAACKNLVTKRYVALAEREDLYQPWEPYNICTVWFVLQGAPEARAAECMEPSMSVPIVPMTMGPKDHPSLRAPLQPSNPLPWNDCYISSFFFASVRSPTLFTYEPVNWVLDLDELSRRDRFFGVDVEKQGALAWKRDGGSMRSVSPALDQNRSRAPEEALDEVPHTSSIAPTSPGDPTCAAVHLVTTGEQQEVQAPASVVLERSPSSSFDGDMDLREEAMGNFTTDSNPSHATVTVNFSHDLSTVRELNNAADFFKEVEQIKRICEEAKPRLAQARALAIKKAADLNAKYDEPTIDMLVARAQRRGRLSRFASATRKRITSTFRPVLRLICMRD